MTILRLREIIVLFAMTKIVSKGGSVLVYIHIC